jgi:tetratricopeptide (TPR) repeat protein
MLIPRATKLAILTVLLGVQAAGAQVDQISALREGNRLFRDGRVEEAHEAYLRGYDPEVPHGVLFYNLGTTAQHLGQLPEAILWYRRAESLSPRDPWLQENLQNARDTLGLHPYEAPGFAGDIARNLRPLLYLAALLAWAGALTWLVRSRRPLRVPLMLLASGILIYAGALTVARAAPMAAVLIEDCASADGDLPAGSEVWVVAQSADSTEIAAGELTMQCPSDVIAPLQAP